MYTQDSGCLCVRHPGKCILDRCVGSPGENSSAELVQNVVLVGLCKILELLVNGICLVVVCTQDLTVANIWNGGVSMLLTKYYKVPQLMVYGIVRHASA